MAITTSVNGLHNIVSVSTDGHLAVWNDANLHKPTHEVLLKMGKDEVTTNSFDFPARDNQTVVLGSDEGYIYKAKLTYDQKDTIYDSIQAHDAPMTAVEFLPVHKSAPTHMSQLFLTSSYDWTVKLWSNSQSTNRPLYTFESCKDYVYDVKWSPKHPAVFACGDGSGKLDIWNIHNDTEVPLYSTTVQGHVTAQTPGSGAGNNSAQSQSAEDQGVQAAVSRLKWAEDGQRIAAGTSVGSLHIYECRSELYDVDRHSIEAYYDKMTKLLVPQP